jgi:hypothetical protein
MLLGVAVTIGAEAYLAYHSAKKVAGDIAERAEKGPSQAQYDALCAGGAWKHDAYLKQTCDRLRAEMEAAARRPPAERARP